MEKKANLSEEEKSDNLSVGPTMDAKLLNDSLHLLQIFPEEIWLKILETVKSNDDLENLNNASPFLRNLLLPNRVLFLFGKVWNKLAPLFDNKDTGDVLFLDDSDAESVITEYGNDCSVVSESDAGSSSSWESYEEDIVAWFKRILKMRKVCRAWCSGIDNFYQNLPQHYKMKEQPSQNDLKGTPSFFEDDEHEQLGQWAVGELVFAESDPEQIEDFLKHFEASHSSEENGRSPFFARDIVIHSEYQEQARMPIDNILLKYGHHIWYCNLKLEDNYPSRLLCYNRLRFMLELMPNLRVLKIRYRRNTKEVRDANKRIRVVEEYPSKEEAEQILQEMETNGLPNFKNLKFFKAKNLPVPIFNELIKKNGHISMLQVKREGVLENDDIYNVPMPNLSKLYMQYYTKADFERLNSSEVNWPLLTSLYLDFDDCPFFEWPEVFKLLEHKWGNQLTDLVINLPQTEVKEEEKQIMRNCSKYELKMEKVKRLRLIISNYTNLDFILPLQNCLEILDVKIRCDLDLWKKSELAKQVKRDQKIIILNLLRSKSEKRETNIWEMMPKLKSYTILITYETLDGRTWYPGKGYPGQNEYYRGETREEWLKEKQRKQRKKNAKQNCNV